MHENTGNVQTNEEATRRKMIILARAQDFVQEFIDKKQIRVELDEMDQLLPYLRNKGHDRSQLVEVFGNHESDRELLASVVRPLHEIQERRRNTLLTHYEIIREQYSFSNLAAAAA